MGPCKVHVSAMQPLQSVTLLSSVCHTAASTVGSCVLEGTAGTEGKAQASFLSLPKTLTGKKKKHIKNRKQGRQRVTSAIPGDTRVTSATPGDTRHSTPWSSFLPKCRPRTYKTFYTWSSCHSKDPLKLWLKKHKHEYRTSLAGRDNAACGETPAAYTVQSLWASWVMSWVHTRHRRQGRYL